ncbi:AfsR/SARP family transcriptional regulator [Longispora albida]|uniref:AfsR/SARP family transcriptional regulator n=1 Tax=Longispora albida TaxID=203523 RepID=UPI00037A0E57|nr:BTAD domain-containing putative transcriptional regulator [Longispora albida]
MEFRALGPLEIGPPHRRVRIDAAKHRILLAALLARANEPVPLPDLVEMMWDGQPPGHPRAAVQTYAARLRQALREAGSSAQVLSQGSGYLLAIAEGKTDLGQFAALVEAADTATDPAAEADALRRALALWRGEPFADVPSPVLHREVVPRLREWQLEVLQRRIEADLRLGRHADLVTELRELTDRFPLREKLWLYLMSALHRSGRRAEALEAFRTLHRRLTTELGIEPAAELAELHLAILNGEHVLTGEPTETVQPPGWHPQCRLPSDVDLVGREADVAALLPARLSVISGLPGVGKTALALHLAHRLRPEYPDGQWYVRLGDRAPADLLAELLRTAGTSAFGVAALPDSAHEREGLLRARLADRRILLVLDDATSAGQVMPLLPGTPGCAVIVTSRAPLTGLTVLAGAQPHRLGPLAPRDAARIVPPDVARLCGYLPLALRIAAARGVTAAELARPGRLDQLSTPGEPEISVRAAFAPAYRALPPDQRAALALLGGIPAADFTVDQAEAALGTPAAARLLGGLIASGLLDRDGHRYRLHPLLRLYAAEQSTPDGCPMPRPVLVA